MKPARPFHVVTVANDLAQYAAMRQSFEAAGFTDAVARFTLHDNSLGPTAEPYEVLRHLDAAGEEPYAVLCHQDVRTNLGHTATDLLTRLRELDRDHPRWAIAGNAGVTRVGHWALHLDDPTGPHRQADLPRRVRSLDENFLVIRRGVGVLVSEGLTGFHFYGTDACLNALSRGRQAFIIDFLLTHLSGGNATSSQFKEAADRFSAAWRPRLGIAFVRTMCVDLRLSRFAGVERVLHRHWPGLLVRRSGVGLWFWKRPRV